MKTWGTCLAAVSIGLFLFAAQAQAETDITLRCKTLPDGEIECEVVPAPHVGDIRDLYPQPIYNAGGKLIGHYDRRTGKVTLNEYGKWAEKAKSAPKKGE